MPWRTPQFKEAFNILPFLNPFFLILKETSTQFSHCVSLCAELHTLTISEYGLMLKGKTVAARAQRNSGLCHIGARSATLW